MPADNSIQKEMKLLRFSGQPFWDANMGQANFTQKYRFEAQRRF